MMMPTPSFVTIKWKMNHSKNISLSIQRVRKKGRIFKDRLWLVFVPKSILNNNQDNETDYIRRQRAVSGANRSHIRY